MKLKIFSNKKAQASILIAIGSVLESIWTGISTISVNVFNVLKTIFDYIFNLFIALYQTAPKFFKIILFLFLMLFFSNAVIGTVLHLNFYCNSNNDLLRPKGFYDGVKLFFISSFYNVPNNTLTYNEFIANNTVLAKAYSKNEPESIISIKCLNETPRLALFGFLDILDYRLWLFLLILSLLIGFYREYLDK